MTLVGSLLDRASQDENTVAKTHPPFAIIWLRYLLTPTDQSIAEGL